MVNRKLCCESLGSHQRAELRVLVHYVSRRLQLCVARQEIRDDLDSALTCSTQNYGKSSRFHPICLSLIRFSFRRRPSLDPLPCSLTAPLPEQKHTQNGSELPPTERGTPVTSSLPVCNLYIETSHSSCFSSKICLETATAFDIKRIRHSQSWRSEATEGPQK